MILNIMPAINIVLDIFSIIICVCLIISLIKSIKNGNKINLWFSLVLFSISLFILSDISNWTCEGTDHYWNVPLLSLGTFFFYFFQPLIFISFLKYVLEYLKPFKTSKCFFNFNLIICSIYMIGLFLTPFFGLYYYFSDNNYYFRGPLYYFTVAINGFFYFSLCYLLLSSRKRLSSIEKISFYSFIIIPLIMEVIQVFNYGISAVNIGFTMSVFLIYINIHKDLENNLKINTENTIKTEKNILEIQNKTIIRLSNLVENRDISGGKHIIRTCKYVELLANKTKQDGYYTEILTDTFISKMVKASPMHDIGKILIPDSILNKPGKLTPQEYLLMQNHVINSESIIQRIVGIDDDKDYIKITKDIAKYHHEKWNGTGYPEQLMEEQIPLAARIMAIADVFDALVSPRSYKNIVSVDYALDIIEEVKGTYFDPILVDEFLLLKDELKNVQNYMEINFKKRKKWI